MNQLSTFKERLVAFLFQTGTDTWLTLLRLGLGLAVTLYALSLRNDWNYLLAGTTGLVNRNLAEAILSLDTRLAPRLGWLVAFGERFGLSEGVVLSIAWFCLLGAGCMLLLGFACRFNAILAWLLQLCAAKSGAFLAYGVDHFMTIGLFYLMLSPLPDRCSADWQLRGLRSKNPQLLGFWQRVLQLHLCIIYFFSGLAKCLGSGWWDGSSVWRALIRPPFNIIDPELLVRLKYLLPVAGILICALEIGYPFFIWSSKTRKLWLSCICALHAGIGLAMGMYLFALVMIVLNVSAFAPDLISSPRPRTIPALKKLECGNY
jgi:Vitamin K-dependent gamma-carboxylase